MSDCCGNSNKCLVYACSGGSNVGQLSNEAAKALDSSEEASMGCLAGLGGNISGMVASAQSGAPVLVIDGCPVGCGKKIADHLGLKGYGYVEITSLGIKKEHKVNKTPANQVDEVVKAAKKEMSKVPGPACVPGGSCCG
jgi:uncharacterized metal-binding protein